jgi:16S rRNA (adenine1518-N6/adenine1519-N6)-dimethyltransferase
MGRYGLVTVTGGVRLLGAGDIRGLAARLDVRPTKKLGQNFVVEPGSVRQIAGLTQLRGGDVVLEVGPGLGSLTLALLEHISKSSAMMSWGQVCGTARRDGAALPDGVPAAGAPASAPAAGAPEPAPVTVPTPVTVPVPVQLVAVEIDPVLAGELPQTIAQRAPDLAGRAVVLTADALAVGADSRLGLLRPTVLAANLPYNVAVPVLLHLLAVLPSLDRGVVMVQAEVADRMCAGPGSRVYGIPSAKLAWYAAARSAGTVPRSVFWPVPNVDSKLVTFARQDPPPTTASRAEVFAVIDAAFSQRRKTLRAALAGWAGSAPEAERALRAAGVDPAARGETLGIADFARIAAR